jgi:hypothetical protein
MHYRNGREAKNGDIVIQLDWAAGKVMGFGKLKDAMAGSDYCNGTLEKIPFERVACLCDCLHVDDLAAILAEKGLDKRPAGM